MKIKLQTILLVLCAFLVAGMTIPVNANDDDDERHEHHNRKQQSFAMKENAVYTQECSSCHFLFPPGLLTAPSWEAVMNGQDKHFGEDLGLDQSTVNEILAFLKENSAEKTYTEWGRKITKSSGSNVYLRITEVPWIMKEHRKISDEVFKRPSIQSRSNCVACHRNAARGDFEEHSVSIPKN